MTIFYHKYFMSHEIYFGPRKWKVSLLSKGNFHKFSLKGSIWVYDSMLNAWEYLSNSVTQLV